LYVTQPHRSSQYVNVTTFTFLVTEINMLITDKSPALAPM